jgi:hypothetical protein
LIENNNVSGLNWLLTTRENSVKLIELSSLNKFSLVYVSSCSNTEPIMDNRYWTSRKDSLELMELSSVYIHILFFHSSNFGGKDNDSNRRNPPSAKEHYLKQARYFPGQSPAAAANRMPVNKKSSVGMGLNASYLPSFHNGHTQSRLGGGYALGGTSGNSVGRLTMICTRA